MKYIKLFENFSSQERQNYILDKISEQGIESLTDDERRFLDSYRDGNQDDINDELNNNDNKTFSNNYFTFISDSIRDDGDSVRFYGKIIVPDPFEENGNIDLDGYILYYRSTEVISPEFFNTQYDIFELVTDLVYELDDFLVYVVGELGY